MSNVIDFLERVGEDAQLRQAGVVEMTAALVSAQITPTLRSAILGGNEQELLSLLGAKANVFCGLYPVEDSKG